MKLRFRWLGWRCFELRSFGPSPLDGPNRGRILRFRVQLGPLLVFGHDADQD